MIDLDLLDIRKTSLNYFVKGEIRDEGLVRSTIKIDSVDIESENQEEISNLRIFNVNFDLIFLDSDAEEEVGKKLDLPEEDMFARLRFNMKTTVRIKTDDSFEDEKINKSILYNIEPYIHKEVKEFCDEIEIPKFSLPLRFWE